MKGIMRNSESGRSMMEIIGVLALMTIMTAGAFVLVRSAMATQRRNQVSDDVINIVAGMRALFAEYDDFSPILNATTSSQPTSDDILDAIGVNRNGPYDGSFYEVKILNEASDPTMQTFRVEIHNLPYRDCIVLLNKPWTDAIDVDGGCEGVDSIEVYYTK